MVQAPIASRKACFPFLISASLTCVCGVNKIDLT